MESDFVMKLSFKSSLQKLPAYAMNQDSQPIHRNYSGFVMTALICTRGLTDNVPRKICLFVSQRDHWVHLCCASRRQITGSERDDRQRHNHSAKRRRIGGRNAV